MNEADVTKKNSTTEGNSPPPSSLKKKRKKKSIRTPDSSRVRQKTSSPYSQRETPSPMSKNIDVLKLNFESCTESVRVIIHPAIVLFLCQLELILKKEVVIVNWNVNHNFWDDILALKSLTM